MENLESVNMESSEVSEMSEGHENTDAAEASGEQAEIPEWQRQKHKLIVDGEEVEVDFETMKKDYQKSSAANKRFMEVKKIQDEVNNDKAMIKEFLQSASKDPTPLLKQLGHDPVAWAEKIIIQQMELDKIPEGERRAKELEEKLARYEQKEQETARERQEREQAEAMNQEVETYKAQFQQVAQGVFQKLGLPENPATMKRVGVAIELHIENGIPLDVESVAEEVERQFKDEVPNFYSKLPPEQLAKYMGEETLKKLRDYDLSRLSSDKKGRAEPVRREARSDNKKMSQADFFAMKRRQLGLE